jgi:hypothetical protein
VHAVRTTSVPPRGVKLTLFDNVVRTDGRPAKYAEDSFTFLNRVHKPLWERIRVELEVWFSEYPEDHRGDLRARFRSPDPGQHFAAWWELYVFHLFRSLGFEVEVHPDVEGRSTHPDFRVERDGEGFYVEAVTVFSGIVEEGRHGTREAWIKDLINEINNRNFFVRLDFEKVGTERPRRQEVIRPIENWLTTLDPDVLRAAAPASEPPKLEVRFRDWAFTVEAFGIAPEHRDAEDHRLLGLGPGMAGWVNDIEKVTAGLKRKFGRYGNLDLPLVVALLGMSSFLDLHDVEQALFGRHAVQFQTEPPYESRTIRQRNGVWMSHRGPTATAIAAVLSGAGVHPWTAARTPLHLWLNPWAATPLRVGLPFARATADDRGLIDYSPAAAAPHEILGLPEEWPGPDPPSDS